MTFNIRDTIGFPPPVPPPRTVDFQSLVDAVDSSVTYPIAYSFGGNAPTELPVERLNNILPSDTTNYGRMFAEDRPYYWNPNSPDWNGIP